MKVLRKLLFLALVGLSTGFGLSIGCTAIRCSEKQDKPTSLDHAEKINSQSLYIIELLKANKALQKKLQDENKSLTEDMLPCKNMNNRLIKITEEMESVIYEVMASNKKLEKKYFSDTFTYDPN